MKPPAHVFVSSPEVEKLSRQPVPASAQLGTARPLGELSVGGTPLLRRVGEVV
jgi:hypothetical protein